MDLFSFLPYLLRIRKLSVPDMSIKGSITKIVDFWSTSHENVFEK